MRKRLKRVAAHVAPRDRTTFAGRGGFRLKRLGVPGTDLKPGAPVERVDAGV